MECQMSWNLIPMQRKKLLVVVVVAVVVCEIVGDCDTSTTNQRD